jgi:hypothetical protein
MQFTIPSNIIEAVNQGKSLLIFRYDSSEEYAARLYDVKNNDEVLRVANSPAEAIKAVSEEIATKSYPTTRLLLLKYQLR